MIILCIKKYHFFVFLTFFLFLYSRMQRRAEGKKNRFLFPSALHKIVFLSFGGRLRHLQRRVRRRGKEMQQQS
jgi:hypothetical protein